MSAIDEVRSVLVAFQAGYMRRDLARVDAFMELFAPGCEVIGTNGIRPGEGEWYPDRATARELVHGDWEGWGDLALDLDNARVTVRGEAAWVAASAAVSMNLSRAEVIPNYLTFIQQHLAKSTASPEEKLLSILRGGSSTLFEMQRGEKFVWPLRFTAVLARYQADPNAGRWLFEQMNFSFPTTHFPDERTFPPTV